MFIILKSHFTQCEAIRNPANVRGWNPESFLWNPQSTDPGSIPVELVSMESGIRDPLSGIQKPMGWDQESRPREPCILLHRSTHSIILKGNLEPPKNNFAWTTGYVYHQICLNFLKENVYIRKISFFSVFKNPALRLPCFFAQNKTLCANIFEQP